MNKASEEERKDVGPLITAEQVEEHFGIHQPGLRMLKRKRLSPRWIELSDKSIRFVTKDVAAVSNDPFCRKGKVQTLKVIDCRMLCNSKPNSKKRPVKKTVPMKKTPSPRRGK